MALSEESWGEAGTGLGTRGKKARAQDIRASETIRNFYNYHKKRRFFKYIRIA